ncbi:hypothetical protein E3C22_16110 [Jiella endophytica]|uniref:Sel1 repeat family protein n=1 Tax=Jiella endophytica TaxID=2558362 RepID=A0A4Y8RF15_9HYPH|nr:SEL1-like repeat protein [Jiella endophytica]TFF20438.1 hypothetical protein E3C22_16110 [Jiella endophytica]
MMRRFAARFAAALILAVAMAGPAPAQTAAPTPAKIAEDAGGLSDLVLPYAPYLFDFAVTSLRSVAQITYSGRRYDPITRSLVVSGLQVDRDKVHFRVGQMRIAADQLILDDVAVDTRPLPLDPTVRDVLDKLGRRIVVGNVTIGFTLDAPRADYLVEATARFDGIGAIDLDADLRGFHFLAPLDSIEGDAAGGKPEIRGRLRTADFAFTDMGLVPVLYDVLGGQQGLDPQAAKGAAGLIAGAAVAGVFEKLPGGPTPALTQRAGAWSAAVQAFLKAPDRLSVSFRPQEPFDLSRLTDGAVTAEDVEALQPDVAAGQTPRQALLSPQEVQLAPDAPLADVLGLAETLLEGRGTPQNAGRALALIMPAAMDGNRAAVALLARTIATDPYIAIGQDKLVPSYVALDLALAEGLPHAAESLVAVGRRLSPAEIVGAEDEAVATWRQTPVGERQRATEIEAFRSRDWPTIRRLAYAYYEGAEMPRNIMRAYGWASIAAAGGDRTAARLRDELTRAAGSGRLVLPLDQARKATDDLWALILGGDKPPSGDKPAGGDAPADAGRGEGAAAPATGSGDPATDGGPVAPQAAPSVPVAPSAESGAGAGVPSADPRGGASSSPAPETPPAKGRTSGEAVDPPPAPAESEDSERETAFVTERHQIPR